MGNCCLCSRNDIVANVGVIAAGAGVGLTGSMWPDLLIGAVIAVLFLKSALYVISRAWTEMRAKPGEQAA